MKPFTYFGTALLTGSMAFSSPGDAKTDQTQETLLEDSSNHELVLSPEVQEVPQALAPYVEEVITKKDEYTYLTPEEGAKYSNKDGWHSYNRVPDITKLDGLVISEEDEQKITQLQSNGLLTREQAIQVIKFSGCNLRLVDRVEINRLRVTALYGQNLTPDEVIELTKMNLSKRYRASTLRKRVKMDEYKDILTDATLSSQGRMRYLELLSKGEGLSAEESKRFGELFVRKYPPNKPCINLGLKGEEELGKLSDKCGIYDESHLFFWNWN